MEITQSPSVIHPASKLKDLQLTATLPSEMVTAQRQLIDWCSSKLAVLETEVKELNEATEHARKMKWKYTTLQNQYRKSLKVMTYYEKVKAALEEGYYIVPNFPIQMFAIRTKADSPEPMSVIGGWGRDFQQEAQQLKEGVGEYKNPFPIIYSQKVTTGEGEKERRWAKEWDDIEFPITMAKPEIMMATSTAMSKKIFDRIGIMPATKKEDPVIIGQIFRTSGYTTKIVSFMIAWHLNTNVI